MKVACIGRTSLLYDTIVQLQLAGHEVACIITTPSLPEHGATVEDFASLAVSNRIPFANSTKLDSSETLRLLTGCDVGVSVHWPVKIPPHVLVIPKFGILNAHCGDLPRYRGNAPISWAMLNHEPDIVFTIHRMEKELDCGYIISQESKAISNSTYIGEVYDWMARIAPSQFLRALDRLAHVPLESHPFASPTAPHAFRCFPRAESDGLLDWSKSNQHLSDLIRVSGRPFLGAYCYVKDGNRVRKLRVLQGHMDSGERPKNAVPGSLIYLSPKTGEAGVCTGDGILALQKCKFDDEPDSFSPGNRWRSTRFRLGMSSEDFLYLTQESLRNGGAPILDSIESDLVRREGLSTLLTE